MDLEFSEEDLKKILESVNRQKNWWKRVREVSDDYSLEPGMSWKWWKQMAKHPDESPPERDEFH
ncbi:hypothetical protein QM565_38730 [Geitlerinema splendidum]|nr:hypothetical protein [Geitlerinema splendidum]